MIATIPGSELPDEWVIYGNHHDAWVNGAHDPASGALPCSRRRVPYPSFGRPAGNRSEPSSSRFGTREEFGLIGSTEWVEKHEAELKQKAGRVFQ